MSVQRIKLMRVDTRTMGGRMREMRILQGTTQQQLGGQRFTKSYICLLEADLTQPTPWTVAEIARRLECSRDYLVRGAPVPKWLMRARAAEIAWAVEEAYEEAYEELGQRLIRQAWQQRYEQVYEEVTGGNDGGLRPHPDQLRDQPARMARGHGGGASVRTKPR